MEIVVAFTPRWTPSSYLVCELGQNWLTGLPSFPRRWYGHIVSSTRKWVFFIAESHESGFDLLIKM